MYNFGKSKGKELHAKAVEDKFERVWKQIRVSLFVRKNKMASSNGGESRWVIVRSAQSLYSVLTWVMDGDERNERIKKFTFMSFHLFELS